MHHLGFSLKRLWGGRNPGTFGDSVHHLEVAEYRGSVDERLGSELVQDGGSGLPASGEIPPDHGVHQPDQGQPAGNANVDGRIGYPFDLYLVFVYLAAPPEPP